MKLAGAVQSPDPRDHLSHGLAEPVRIERRRSHGVRILRRLERQGHQVAGGVARDVPGGGRCGGPGRGLGPLHGIHGLRKRSAAHVLEEVDAVDQLHREEPLILVREKLVQPDEVRVGDVGEGPELALQPEERLDVAVAESLEGHHLVALPVERLIDDAETSSAEAPLDLKALGPAEDLFPGEVHGPLPFRESTGVTSETIRPARLYARPTMRPEAEERPVRPLLETVGPPER